MIKKACLWLSISIFCSFWIIELVYKQFEWNLRNAIKMMSVILLSKMNLTFCWKKYNFFCIQLLEKIIRWMWSFWFKRKSSLKTSLLVKRFPIRNTKIIAQVTWIVEISINLILVFGGLIHVCKRKLLGLCKWRRQTLPLYFQHGNILCTFFTLFIHIYHMQNGKNGMRMFTTDDPRDFLYWSSFSIEMLKIEHKSRQEG